MKSIVQSFMSSVGVGLFAVAAIMITMTGCSDDPSSPEPTGTSQVTFIHANPAYTNQVGFYAGNATSFIGTLLGYGGAQVGTVNNGGVTFHVKATTGEELASANTTLDSSTSTIVVFSGDAQNDELFSITTEKADPVAGNALVRFVHASKSEPKMDLRINNASGLKLATGIAYKQATDEFVSVPVSTTDALLVMDPSDNSVVDELSVTLMDGVSYTIIMYGAKAGVNEYKTKLAIVAEP